MEHLKEIISNFDDIVSPFRVILEDTCSAELLRFITYEQPWHLRQKEGDEECKNWKSRLDNANIEVSSLQKRLNEERKLIDSEKKHRCQYESDVVKYTCLFDEIRNYVFKNDPKLNLSEETKKKLSTFDKSLQNLNTEYSNLHDREEARRYSSGSSNLSDVSNVETEDDLTDSRLLHITTRRTKRQNPNEEKVVSVKRRKSNVISFSPTAPRAESTESLESDIPSVENQSNKCHLALDRLNSKPHCYVPKAVYKTERCLSCNKQIGFGHKVLKCTECKAIVHKECSNQLPLPCIRMGTPKKQGTVGSLDDYAPPNSPSIPAVVIHCVNEIEHRGLNEIGLYRIPGIDSEVKALKEKFLKCKGAPNLTEHDIFVVCGCLKDFLRSLKDSLIPKAQRPLFVEAVSRDHKTEVLRKLISELAPVHRDTLAFLVLHLKRVADSPVCKMSQSNLATVFGPTVVGYSSDDVADAAVDVQVSNAIMKELLALPESFWNRFIIGSTEASLGNTRGGNLKCTPRAKRYFPRD